MEPRKRKGERQRQTVRLSTDCEANHGLSWPTVGTDRQPGMGTGRYTPEWGQTDRQSARHGHRQAHTRVGTDGQTDRQPASQARAQAGTCLALGCRWGSVLPVAPRPAGLRSPCQEELRSQQGAPGAPPLQTVRGGLQRQEVQV